MAATNRTAAPDLVLIDVGAPLEESLRRLQSQLAYVSILAAQEADSQSSDVHVAGSNPQLLRKDKGKPIVTTSGEAERRKSEFESESVAALRRRIAQKLRRLSEEQQMDLCVARFSLEDAEMDDVVPSHHSTTPATSPGLPTHTHQLHEVAQQQQKKTHEDRAREKPQEVEEDDLFSWVTSESVPAAAPIATTAAAVHAPFLKSATTPDVDATVQRIAQSLADVVEARYRNTDRLEDVYQQLLQLLHYTNELLDVPQNGRKKDQNEEGKGKREPCSPAMVADCAKRSDNIRDLLSYRPTHTIASEKEKDAWQRAWQVVLPVTAINTTVLEVGDTIEMVDIAVLAHVNAQRYAALQRRWNVTLNNYVGLVEELNRRFAQAALQLEEMERRP